MTPRTTGTFFSFATQSLAAVVLMAACHSGGGSSTRLMSIAVTPTNPSIASGTSAQLVATGTYSDSRTKDITAQATWSSSDPAAVVVSNAAGSVGLAQGLVPGDVTVSATFMGISGSTGLTVSSAALVAIEVTPGQPSIALGTSLDFVATGVFTDATTQDLTAQAVWESSDASAATVANGLATSVGVGSTTISATFSGITGSVDLEVTAAVVVAIQVTPTDPSIALGTQQVFTATGVFSDATTQDLTAQAAWSSSSPAAAVSNAAPDQGLAQSHAVGSATITATFSGLSGSSTLTVTGAALVSIAVTPTNPSIALGTQQAFTATGTFTDATVQDLSAEVTWSSSDATVVAVSNADGSRGLASSISVGDTTITASLDGIDGSTMLTVSSAALVSIEVSPAAPSIALGYAQPFVATGTYTDGSTQDVTDEVTWSSSSASTASVSNADGSRGLATSLGVGSTTISAMFAGISGSTTLAVSNAVLVSLEVSPDSFSIAKGTEQAFSALGVFSDGTRQDLTGEVTWASSDESVAKVSNAADSAGLAKGVGVGSASISATLDGIGGSTGLDVTSAVLVSIDVLPFAPSFAKGTDLQLHAVGTYSDESEQDLTADVAWSSSDALVAVVSNAAGSRGIATALAVGSSTVTASFSGISGTADLAVSPAVLDAIWIDPTDPSVPVGMTRSFTATGVFSDASTQDLTARVTWSSSDATVVAVSNAAGSEGLAKGLSTGSVTISASLAGVTGATSMSVTSIVLVSIDLSPADPFVPSGYSIHLQATGNYSDGSAVDLTKLAVWTSSATVFATVSNAIGTEGKLSGRSSGSTTVTATYSGVSSSTVVTVTNESLVSISVSPSPVTLDVGETVQMTAMGLFSGGTLVDVTGSVRWFSSNKHVASVGNALSKGLVTAQKAGTMTIRARKGNRFDTAPGSVL